MKFIFILIAFTFLMNLGHAYGPVSSFESFESLDEEGKVEMLKNTISFLKQMERSNSYSEKDIEQARWIQEKILRFFIDEAHAGTNYNCFFAGWPSQTVAVNVNGETKNICSSPKNKNDSYKSQYKKSCGDSELLCNPVLFGEALCVKNGTKAEKQMSFAQCEAQFKEKKRSLKDVIASVEKKGLKADLKALFDMVDKVCKTGMQSKTPMCRNLESKVAKLRAEAQLKTESKPPKTATATPTSTPTPKPTVVVIDNGQVVQGKNSDDLIACVQTLNDVNQKTVNEGIIPVSKSDCDIEKNPKPKATPTPFVVDDKVLSPEEESVPIDQSKSLSPDYCLATAEEAGLDEEKYMITKFSDPKDRGGSMNLEYRGKIADKQDRSVIGFTIYADQYGQGKPYVEKGKSYPEDDMSLQNSNREYSFEHQPRGGPFNSFSVIDYPVSEHYDGNGKLVERFKSTSMHWTEYFYFPRKVTPSVKKRDDKVYVTMTTGEQTVYDAVTGKLIDGVANEMPVKDVIVKKAVPASWKDDYPLSKTQVLTYPATKYNYQGAGIWIESYNNGATNPKQPGSILPVKSIVDGKTFTCNLKSENIFNYTTGFRLPEGHPKRSSSNYRCYSYKFKTDQEFYNLIKSKCPDFKFPALAK